MVKAILFDLDRTLLDRDQSVQRFINSQYDRLENILSYIDKKEYVSKFLELDQYGYMPKDEVYQQMVALFGMKGLTWKELLDDYNREFMYSCIGFPNLIFMLDKLKKRSFLLGIITNGHVQFQMDNIKSLGIENYFDTILISRWEGIKKPDPNIFLRAVNHLCVEPSECMFIGDHLVNDIQAAKKVGMKAVWKRAGTQDHMDVDYIIDDLREIVSIGDEIG
ncbi:HAD family hydrolase [Ornithinibacillus salinisoli]|uniref:HAD family hydrolase n=1 Tax=Ornithinibacillus salinisoli TaxID=1848459 RepID=A0ABW4VZ76_9BACI